MGCCDMFMDQKIQYRKDVNFTQYEPQIQGNRIKYHLCVYEVCVCIANQADSKIMEMKTADNSQVTHKKSKMGEPTLSDMMPHYKLQNSDSGKSFHNRYKDQ